MGKRRNSNDAKVSEKSWWAISGLFLFTMAALLLFTYNLTLYGHLDSSWKRPEIILSVLLVLGVVVLLLSLAFTSVIFKSLGLSDRNQSLGLPEGSVRAVIALSLILIFMMSAVFLYMEVDQREYKSKGTKAILDEMPKENIVSIRLLNETYNNESLYEVIRVVKKDTTSTDLAKQIVTTMSTLVVAVAAFYFGTKSVAIAKQKDTGEPDETPVITGISQDAAMLGEDFNLRIEGKHLESVKEVRLVQGTVKIDATEVKAESSTVVTCHVNIPLNKPTGVYTVLIIDDDGEETKLADSFTVNPKTG